MDMLPTISACVLKRYRIDNIPFVHCMVVFSFSVGLLFPFYGLQIPGTLLASTMRNCVEFILTVIVLKSGKIAVVQASVLDSILFDLLFVRLLRSRLVLHKAVYNTL